MTSDIEETNQNRVPKRFHYKNPIGAISILLQAALTGTATFLNLIEEGCRKMEAITPCTDIRITICKSRFILIVPFHLLSMTTSHPKLSDALIQKSSLSNGSLEHTVLDLRKHEVAHFSSSQALTEINSEIGFGNRSPSSESKLSETRPCCCFRKEIQEQEKYSGSL